jgi:NADH:ubiquinone oxidoreductase subunit 5 (subunit L)/multisubunit Na+/H+ antiporter MnhA subunit
MSGVMIKMGLYGILRLLTFLGPPAPWWGLTLAGLGLLTGLVGISLALSQRDVKRMLAYSSIENMGLVGLTVGVGLWGWAADLPAVAALGMAGGLLHIWNHVLMKGLMFFAAGSVLHGTGARDMERLGGLMRRMPWTAGALMFGAVAIAALPPLNGFVSKWLMYLALVESGLAGHDSRSLTALFAVGALALIGALSAMAFVRLTGVVLLGSPRSPAAEDAHESSPWMLAPMYVLVFLCLVMAVVPNTVVRVMPQVFEQVLVGTSGQARTALAPSAAPLGTVGSLNAWTLAMAGGGLLLASAVWRTSPRGTAPTWGCGYTRPTVRMQYTGRSFAEMLAEHLLPRSLRPRMARAAPQGLFPAASAFETACPDPLSERFYEPLFRRCAERFSQLRILQQGKVHVYLVYIVCMVVLALVWVSLRRWWGAA